MSSECVDECTRRGAAGLLGSLFDDCLMMEPTRQGNVLTSTGSKHPRLANQSLQRQYVHPETRRTRVELDADSSQDLAL